jgi:putative ABC transport system permease protein
VGFWVAVIFALVPLLRVRDVPPLAAFRSDFEQERGRLPGRLSLLALASLVASVFVLAVAQAPDEEDGVAFAVGITLAAGLLWLLALLITRAARAFFPRSAAYPVRQGIANLFRPRNQTLTVTLALGFGAFVVGTLLQVEASLVGELRRGTGQERPSLVLFDVQPDQTEGVLALLPPGARATAEVTPMVPARIARLHGRGSQEILNDTSEQRAERWAVRREYRHTFRSGLAESEELVAGQWFDQLPPHREGEPARVSMEADLATSLDVAVGDTVVWDFAGREVPSVITSLRFVDWGRLTTNFFVVFEPGVVDDAPRMDVVLLEIPDAGERATLQRDLVDAYPTVSAIDVQQVQEALGRVLAKIESAVHLLALACALAGLLVLGGSLATSREQRTREAALLRTLGARRGQLLGVLVTEYAALGTTAALAGLLLAAGAAAWVTSQVLGFAFTLHLPSLAAVWAGVSLLTVLTGLLASRSVLTRPPLPVLRGLAQ